MTDARELVERLRARCSYGDARLWQKHDPLSMQAANLIERQSKIIEKMAEFVKRGVCPFPPYSPQWSEYVERKMLVLTRARSLTKGNGEGE